jgi:hypothetical protein
MERDVQPELLDQLPAGDHHAVHSRRDLQKINAWMGHAGIMSRVLTAALSSRPPQSVVELGSGDGTLLLKLAKRFAPHWKPSRVVLVDRQALVTAETVAAFASLSWPVEFAQMDVFEWLERARPASIDLTLTTLFLHHFVEHDLRGLLQRIATQTRVFLACEPRRSKSALGGTRLLRLIGCNQVTRHDARVSVRAGFTDRELSALWPLDACWRLVERQAGPFTHCFFAERTGALRP